MNSGTSIGLRMIQLIVHDSVNALDVYMAGL